MTQAAEVIENEQNDAPVLEDGADSSASQASVTSPQELRKTLRTTYPDLFKGQVGVFVRTDEATAVLTGSRTAEDVANAVKARVASAKRKQSKARSGAGKPAADGEPAVSVSPKEHDRLVDLLTHYCLKRKQAGKPVAAAEILEVNSLLNLMASVVG